MTKTELMETYTAEQLAEMVIKFQDDCHRFSIEGLQRYLKIPAPIKIPKSNSENIEVSKIQKCQDEYEKILKESPLESTINKISRDILEQKNNAMAMEFTRIICDLLKKYGVHVHCTETKFRKNITHNSIEEKYGIVFDSMDFSEHDKEFTDKIEKLKKELERRQSIINQIDEILKELFGATHDIAKPDEFKEILRGKAKECITDFLPAKPIKVADMLINANERDLYENSAYYSKIFDVSDLRQIAEHLLVYCNHHGEAEE